MQSSQALSSKTVITLYTLCTSNNQSELHLSTTTPVQTIHGET